MLDPGPGAGDRSLRRFPGVGRAAGVALALGCEPPAEAGEQAHRQVAKRDQDDRPGQQYRDEARDDRVTIVLNDPLEIQRREPEQDGEGGTDASDRPLEGRYGQS